MFFTDPTLAENAITELVRSVSGDPDPSIIPIEFGEIDKRMIEYACSNERSYEELGTYPSGDCVEEFPMIVFHRERLEGRQELLVAYDLNYRRENIGLSLYLNVTPTVCLSHITLEKDCTAEELHRAITALSNKAMGMADALRLK